MHLLSEDVSGTNFGVEMLKEFVGCSAPRDSDAFCADVVPNCIYI